MASSPAADRHALRVSTAYCRQSRPMCRLFRGFEGPGCRDYRAPQGSKCSSSISRPPELWGGANRLVSSDLTESFLPEVKSLCGRWNAVYLEFVQRSIDQLSETSSFEGLLVLEPAALRLELICNPSFSAPTSWSLFETSVGVWQVRRVWIDTRNSPRSNPFRYGSDAKLEPGLADSILHRLEALVLPAFAPPLRGVDGTWRAVRRRNNRSLGVDVALSWWEEPPGFSSANQWFDWATMELDEALPDRSPTT